MVSAYFVPAALCPSCVIAEVRTSLLYTCQEGEHVVNKKKSNIFQMLSMCMKFRLYFCTLYVQRLGTDIPLAVGGNLSVGMM